MQTQSWRLNLNNNFSTIKAKDDTENTKPAHLDDHKAEYADLIYIAKYLKASQMENYAKNSQAAEYRKILKIHDADLKAIEVSKVVTRP